MIFLNLLNSGEEIDCDLIVGDVDMPASFVWGPDIKLTNYGVEKFSKLLNSSYTILANGNIEIHCNDDNIGYDFTLSAAGYINDQEYKRIFEDKL
jgi:hypothetical protein